MDPFFGATGGPAEARRSHRATRRNAVSQRASVAPTSASKRKSLTRVGVRRSSSRQEPHFLPRSISPTRAHAGNQLASERATRALESKHCPVRAFSSEQPTPLDCRREAQSCRAVNRITAAAFVASANANAVNQSAARNDCMLARRSVPFFGGYSGFSRTSRC